MAAHAFLTRLGVNYPIIQAPMAGGITTPGLVAAVSNAGGLGSIGAGYLSAEHIEAVVTRVQELSARPFGVNLFVSRTPEAPTPEALQAAREALAPLQRQLRLPEATLPDRVSEDFDAQFGAVLALRPRVFSFTFGVLDARRVEALHAAGSLVIGTATTVAEARALEASGVDAVVAQGSEAGGHRGTFLGSFEDALIGTLALVPQVVDAVRVPVIASGGLMDGRGIRAALTLGASAVQLGTAFLACDEAGTSAPYRQALLSAADDATVLTRAFSGRPARGLANQVTRSLPQGSILPYPYQNALTRELRAEAGRQGRAEFLSLWAGQAARMVRPMPAGELVATLVREAGLE